MKKNLTLTFKNYTWITIGSIIYALGFDWMYVPNQIGVGGLTGLGQIANFLVPALPIGTVVLVINIPVLLLGWKFLGGHTLISTLYATAATSILVDLLAAIYSFQPMEPVLAAVFGGALMGLSLGIIFARGATTGGTDMIARLLKIPFAWLPMGKLLMVVDLISLLMVAAVFQRLDSALYGMIALYISSVVMDWVLYGLDSSKVAYIVTDNPRPLAEAIDRELDRGATFLHGEGSFSRQEKLVLMCAFKQRQIVALKALVHEMDPNAFIIVCNAHEVLGEGFRRYQKDDL